MHSNTFFCQRPFSSATFLIIAALFILTPKTLSAQFNFNNDTAFIEVFRTLKHKIDTSFNLTKDFDFECRFWVNYGKMTGTTLFVLTNKNNAWTARLFKKQNHPETELSEIPVSNKDLDELWRKLEANHILTIKESYELKDKNGNDPDLLIHDGSSFYFELVTNDRRRNYSYRCPEYHREEYKYIKEYKWVLNMIKLIYRHCKLNRNSLC